MAIAHVATTILDGAGTTSSIDTTGASLLVVGVSSYGPPSGSATISDSKSNTWTLLTLYAGVDYGIQVYYATNPSVGSGHTVTTGGGLSFPGLVFSAFSGVDTASPFDVENGNSAIASTNQAGTVTPSNANSLVISAAAIRQSGMLPTSIDGGFTILDQGGGVSGIAVGMAYLIQTSIAAADPTWTFSASNASSITSAVFKAASGGGGGGGLVFDGRTFGAGRILGGSTLC